MKSPFPGMDPYLEQHWEDVHTRLIGYTADELQPQLSEDLIARMEEKICNKKSPRRLGDRPFQENVTVWQNASNLATPTLDEPLLLEPLNDPIHQRSILIFDSLADRIVTVIEILCPWNKTPDEAVQDYVDKRNDYINAAVNLVEIDLIRAGDWTDMIWPSIVPQKALTAYRVTIVQPEAKGPHHYPISIRAKLPTIKIPLRLNEAAAKLNLQGLIEKAYTMGRYNRIDYSKPCKPPLEGSEKEWAAELIKK